MDDQRREQPDNDDTRPASGPVDTRVQDTGSDVGGDSDRDSDRDSAGDSGRDSGPAAEAARRDRQRDTDGDTGRAVGGVAEDELRPQGGRTAASGADTRDADRQPTQDTDGADDADDTDDADGTNDADDADDADGRAGAVDPAEQQRSAEEFAQEHDPAKHDVAAGADARQPGDWTADEAGGPQVWDADGKLVEGDAPGLQSSQRADGSSSETGSSGTSGSSGDSGASSGSSGQGRTSSLDEVRDGGYGVGSAATIDDGAVPMGHPVKAWEDTKTFVAPGHDQYDAAEPHLWFTDDGAAERAGFRHVD